MAENRVSRRLFGILTMIVGRARFRPACQSAGWAPSPSVRSPDDVSTSTRFSLRPILDGAGYRPYYVGGYAGASYGPGLFARRECLRPRLAHRMSRSTRGPGRRNETGRARNWLDICRVEFIGSQPRRRTNSTQSHRRGGPFRSRGLP